MDNDKIVRIITLYFEKCTVCISRTSLNVIRYPLSPIFEFFGF